MHNYIYGLLMTLMFFIKSHAQPTTSDKGIVLYKLGADTTAVQQFEYNRYQFKTSLVFLTGGVTRCDAVGELDPSGDLKKVTSTTYQLNINGQWLETFKGENTFSGDSTIFTSTTPSGKVTKRAFLGKGIVANGTDLGSFYTFPFMGFFAPTQIGDTLIHKQLSLNTSRKFMVYRYQADKVKIGSTLMGYIHLTIDKQGRLLEANAVGSSLNFIATVNRTANAVVLDQVAKRHVSKETLVARTFRDTVSVNYQTSKVDIDYWRPYRRGRTIFGATVPWNRTWRTGANNATQLRTNATLLFGNHQLSAGNYGVWSLPTETTCDLIINRNATAWGTDHDPSADIFRVSMKVERLSTPIEILEIKLIPLVGQQVKLVIEWDTYRASTEFKIESK